MPTYIDSASIALNDTITSERCRALGLGGLIVPTAWRYVLLRQAVKGDSVICGVEDLDFWRKLIASVRLVSIADPDNADPISKRFGSWYEWAAVQQGIPRKDAEKYLIKPPKTKKHHHYLQWETANSQAYVLSKMPHVSLPELLVVEAPVVEHTLPYKYTLVDNADALHLANGYFSMWRTLYACGEMPAAGLDVETDVVLDHPNEMHDKLVGVGIAFGEDCFYGSIEYEPWAEVLHKWLPQLSWSGHNAKYDRSILRRHGLPTGTVAGDSLLAAHLLESWNSEPDAESKEQQS